MAKLKFQRFDIRNFGKFGRRKAIEPTKSDGKEGADYVANVELVVSPGYDDEPDPSQTLPVVTEPPKSEVVRLSQDSQRCPPGTTLELSFVPTVGPHSQKKLRADRTDDAFVAHVDESSRSIAHSKGIGLDEHGEDIGFPEEEVHGQVETQVEGSAFRTAFAKRSPEEQVVLSARHTIEAIFSELERMDAEHLEGSYARKGIQLMGRATRGLNFTLDVVSPVANFEPAAACGLAVVKSVVMLAAALCGAESSLQENTEELLNHIPIIVRYDESQTADCTRETQEVLVLVYDDLLDFYFEACRILRSKNFVRTLAHSAIRQRLANIISSFSAHTERLFRNITVETSIMLNRIIDDQLEWNVRELLGADRSKEVDIHNNLGGFIKRADDACKWILDDLTFQTWTDLSSDLRCIALIGNTGNGKTWITSYVAATLPTLFSETSFVAPAVCSYYCKDDNKTNNLLNIYRSLVRQLFSKQDRYKSSFYDRYKEAKKVLPIEPTESINFLSESLFNVLKPTRQAIYVLIDGLDECSSDSLDRLMDDFKKLFSSGSRVKLFLSHRPDENMRGRMPKGSSTVHMEKSEARDHQIVRYIVDEDLCYLRADVRDLVVTDLSYKADGSAIWVRLVVDYLKTCEWRMKAPIMKALKGMPSPQNLAELYAKLFEKAVRGEHENMRDLVLILEFLTHALRPLTLLELACAVAMGANDADDLTNFAEANAFIDTGRTRQLARSFTSIPATDDSDNASVSLVHQSLKEVIRQTPPIEWLPNSRLLLARPNEVVEYGLYVISQNCLRYLLLEDCDPQTRTHSAESESSAAGAAGSTSSYNQSTTPPNLETSVDTFVYPEPWAQSPIVGAFFAGAEHVNSWRVGSLARRFKFYDYAISYWAAHFYECHPPAKSAVHSLGVDLYRKMSPQDWDDHFRTRKVCPEGCPSNPDALTVCCFFGHLQVALQISDTFDVGPSQLGSALYWAAQQGHVECVKLLYSRIGENTSFCYRSGRSPLAAAASDGHAACVNFFLEREAFGINERDSTGRTALSLSVSGSHVGSTSVLLSHEPKDRLDLNLADNRGWSPLFWADGPNAAALISMLLRDQRTEPNLLDCKQRNALSWVCEEGSCDLVKLFVADKRVRLNIRDSMGRTPLIYAIKSKDLSTVKSLFRQRHGGELDAQRELDLNAVDFDGRNAVSWAAAVQDSTILRFLLTYAPEQACVPDIDGWSPLAWTLNPPGYPDNSKLLFPHTDNGICSVALSTAIRWERPEIAKLIIEHTDIIVDLKTRSGRTALSFAASTGYLEIVQLLMETKDADASIADDKGRIPLEYAKRAGHVMIVNYLESRVNTVAGAQQGVQGGYLAETVPLT